LKVIRLVRESEICSRAREKEFFINTKIEIDNSKEYSDSLKLLDQLLEFEEKIKVKLAQEKREIEIHEESMLERNQFDKVKK
jgi:hypothetical protein